MAAKIPIVSAMINDQLETTVPTSPMPYVFSNMEGSYQLRTDKGVRLKIKLKIMTSRSGTIDNQNEGSVFFINWFWFIFMMTAIAFPLSKGFLALTF